VLDGSGQALLGHFSGNFTRVLIDVEMVNLCENNSAAKARCPFLLAKALF
jgi:hypothetical protein